MIVNVVDRHERRNRPVNPARGDDGQLAFEIDEGFENGFVAAQLVPGFERIVVRSESNLPFSVVPERGRLKDRRTADCPHAIGEIDVTANRCERRDRQPEIVQKRFFANPMLRDFECAAVWPDDRVCFGGRHRERGDILELEGHDVDAARKLPNPIDIVVRGDDLDIGDLSCRRVVFRRERVHAIAQPSGGHREHAAELAAAKDADD